MEQHTEKKVMTEAELVEALHKYTLKNKIFDAVCHMWAFRQRARRQVTVAGLMYSMKKQGFKNYTKEQYKEILLFLAVLGIGKLKSNDTQLVDIEISLQSLGRAALNNNNKIEPLTKIRPEFVKFKKIKAASEDIHKKQFVEPTIPNLTVGNDQKKSNSRTYPAFLTVLIEGKPIKFKAPDNITADNLMEFLTDFREVVS